MGEMDLPQQVLLVGSTPASHSELLDVLKGWSRTSFGTSKCSGPSVGEDPTTQAYILHGVPFSRPPSPPSFTTLRPGYAGETLEKPEWLHGEPMRGKQRWALGEETSAATCSASPYLGDAHPEPTRKS